MNNQEMNEKGGEMGMNDANNNTSEKICYKQGFKRLRLNARVQRKSPKL